MSQNTFRRTALVRLLQQVRQEDMTTIELTDDNFEDALKDARLPVLVDFWAPWRGPCKALAPVLDELSEEHASVFVVGKLNIDGNPEAASNWNVMSLPTLMLFRNGAPVMTFRLASKSEIKQKVLAQTVSWTERQC